MDTNIIKLSTEALAKIKLDPILIRKMKELEEKNTKIRKKKYF
jgi:hypothetical protein